MSARCYFRDFLLRHRGPCDNIGISLDAVSLSANQSLSLAAIKGPMRLDSTRPSPLPTPVGRRRRDRTIRFQPGQRVLLGKGSGRLDITRGLTPPTTSPSSASLVGGPGSGSPPLNRAAGFKGRLRPQLHSADRFGHIMPRDVIDFKKKAPMRGRHRHFLGASVARGPHIRSIQAFVDARRSPLVSAEGGSLHWVARAVRLETVKQDLVSLVAFWSMGAVVRHTCSARWSNVGWLSLPWAISTAPASSNVF
jgi:hypothetical protein